MIDGQNKRIQRVGEGKNSYDATNLLQLLNHVQNRSNPHSITPNQAFMGNDFFKYDTKRERMYLIKEVDNKPITILEFGVLPKNYNYLDEEYFDDLVDVYGLRIFDDNGNLIVDLTSAYPYIDKYTDLTQLEFELMKMTFSSIEWAQFAVFDSFSDESLRANPEPATNKAKIEKGYITCSDSVPNKEFIWTSKTYTDITIIETGSSTSVANGYLQNTSKSWWVDQHRNLILVDSNNTTFIIQSNDVNKLIVIGTPTAGAYKIKAINPSLYYSMALWLDSVSDPINSKGFVKLEISWNGGTNWETILDTLNSINELDKSKNVTNSGDDYKVRITLKNDANGLSPRFNKFLICTNPDIWRF